MKKFIIASMFSAIASTLTVYAAPTVPAYNQIEEITLIFHKGWMVEFRPDGSAELIYGSSVTDVAVAPKQTFSFQNIYNLLASHLTENPSGEKSVAVNMRVTGQTSSTALYLEDKSTITKIMSDARDKSVPLNQSRFNELLAKHPLVPDTP